MIPLLQLCCLQHASVFDQFHFLFPGLLGKCFTSLTSPTSCGLHMKSTDFTFTVAHRWPLRSYLEQFQPWHTLPGFSGSHSFKASSECHTWFQVGAWDRPLVPLNFLTPVFVCFNNCFLATSTPLGLFLSQVEAQLGGVLWWKYILFVSLYNVSLLFQATHLYNH